MKRISLIFQYLLQAALVFFLAFIWTRYFFKRLWLSLCIAIALTVVAQIALFFLTRKKDRRLNLKLKEKEEAENMFLSLGDANPLDFFLTLAKKESLDCEKKKDCIILRNFKSTNLLVPFTTLDPLTAQDVARCIRLGKKHNSNKIVITCGEISKDAQVFAQSVEQNIVLLDKFATYSQLYKYYGIFPPVTTTYKKSKKLAWREMLAYSFNRSRTKGYFFAALVLFASTLFIRMNIYYCISASLLLLFALISYFNPYFNKTSPHNALSL